MLTSNLPEPGQIRGHLRFPVSEDSDADMDIFAISDATADPKVHVLNLGTIDILGTGTCTITTE